MARPFVIDEDVIKKCTDLRATAEAYPISLERMQRLAARAEAGDMTPDPQMGLQTIHLPFGFAITFTIETAPNAVQVRHFSISIDDPLELPNPRHVEMVLPYFGWIGGVRNAFPQITALQGGGQCIELIQPVSGDMSEIVVKDPA